MRRPAPCTARKSGTPAPYALNVRSWGRLVQHSPAQDELHVALRTGAWRQSHPKPTLPIPFHPLTRPAPPGGARPAPGVDVITRGSPSRSSGTRRWAGWRPGTRGEWVGGSTNSHVAHLHWLSEPPVECVRVRQVRRQLQRRAHARVVPGQATQLVPRLGWWGKGGRRSDPSHHRMSLPPTPATSLTLTIHPSIGGAPSTASVPSPPSHALSSLPSSPAPGSLRRSADDAVGGALQVKGTRTQTCGRAGMRRRGRLSRLVS